jgi:cytosine/adenosine deaminase-related metal-dependent hydrolase
MGTILLEKIDMLATFDARRRVLKNAWLLIRDDTIAALGTEGDDEAFQAAEEVLRAAQEPGGSQFSEDVVRIDLSGHIVLPGLINTHHHHFQTLLRNVPSMQNASLFPWLHDLYLLMSEVMDEDQYVAALVAQAELLLSGCTTNTDHSYLKVNDMQFDTSVKAAQEMGIRFHLARGSFSIGQSQGGLPPDHIVEEEDDILADTERLIRTYHDPKARAMVRVANAPCSPFSITPRLMRESVEMARKYGVHSHTHLAESPDDERYMDEVYGRTSVEMAQEWGWVGPDVWYAHAVQLNESDMDIVARTGTAVAHCPNSNMYLASGCCPVTPLLKRGATVGLGVDGSASNNSSNLLDEVRNALLLQRVFYGADSMSPTQALEVATLGSAKLLGRDDIGVLAPGMAADLIGINTNRLPFAGGLHDPVAALVLCDAGTVDLNIVNGQIRARDGRLIGIDLPGLIKRQNELAGSLVGRTEKRYGVALGMPVWRRAYPYDAAN